MGCGASSEKDNKKDSESKKEDSKYKKDETTKPEDDSVDEDMEDIEVPKKTVTTVMTTGNRKASSTTGIPKLYNTGGTTYGENEDFDSEKNKPAAKEKDKEENFVFGDFDVDPEDVQRQRLERFQKKGKEEEKHESTRRRSSGGKPGAVSRTGEMFMLNDFVVSVDNDEEERRAQAARAKKDAELFSVEIPNFRLLKKYHTSPFLGHTSRVKAVAVSPDERCFLSSSIDDQAISLFSMQTGEELNCIFGHQGSLISLSFSRDGKFFASSSRDSSIAIWDSSQSRESSVRRQVRWLDGDSGGGGSMPIATAFSWNCQYIIGGYQDRVCRVWDIAKAIVCGTFSQHAGVIVCVATHPKENIAASGASDRTICLWNIPSCNLQQHLTGHEGAIISVNFSPDGEKLLSNDDRCCRIWSTKDGKVLMKVNLQDIVASVSSGVHETGALKFNQTDAFGSEEPPPPPPPPTPAQEKFKKAVDGKNTLASAKAAHAAAAQSQRIVFTVSTLCPGALSHSYFAVACTDRNIYLINASNGKAEGTVPTKASVFAISAGRINTIIYGDNFGNLYRLVLKS